MRFYELSYLLPAELSPEELKSFQEKIISCIQEKEGKIINLNKPIRKNLEYLISKKSQAFLVSLDFQINPKELEGLEKKLKEKKEILRFLLITKKPLKEVEAGKKPLKAFPKITTQKVELKELEEKLEEILGEKL